MHQASKAALTAILAVWFAACGTHCILAQAPLGIFQDHGDVGKVLHPGSATFAFRVYTVSGSGENMWFGEDDFHFVWKKVSGDISLTSDTAFLHRPAATEPPATIIAKPSLCSAEV